MHKRTDVVFLYDGTFDGFLSCVYLYYYSSYNPLNIVSEENFEPGFYQNISVKTDNEKSNKVKNAIVTKISKYTLRFLQECMLCCKKDMEINMLFYLVKSFKYGYKFHKNIADANVDYLLKAHRHLQREKHLYLGIIRFYKSQDVYISQIEPKNNIIPLIASHFLNRFYNQNFLIYDSRNKTALIHYEGESQIIKAEKMDLPKLSDDELDMQRLWKHFYDTVSIKERYNPKCRMNFMPKRTWEFLPEMNENL